MNAHGRLAGAAVAAGFTAAALLHGHAQTRPAQTFRTGTDVVFVDVSVRNRGQAVTGLTADDFVLTDNGVRQRIDSVEATAVPIDLTLVVDVSGNTRSPWAVAVSAPAAVAELQAEIDRVAAMLRPDDRLRLLAIDTEVQELWPMQPAAPLPALPLFRAGGMPALYDTLAAALLQPVEPARRHVVIARTKGLDTFSSVNVEAVAATAERSDALFHVVAMETALDNDSALSGFQCTQMGFCWPTRKFWIPFQRRLIGPRPVHQLHPDGQVLASAAEATGGGLHQAAFLTVPTLTSTFRKTFDDFRNNYVLRYTPQGLPRTGWHDIEVRVPRSRSYTVRARKGYLVEEPVRAPAPVTVPEVPRTLAELTTAYARGSYRQVLVGLRQLTNPDRLLHEFEDGGNPWPATPWKEAAFALELAEPAIFSQDEEVREAGHALLVRFSRLVRHPLEPDAFERYWYFAAVTMLEGTIRSGATSAFVDRAIERFPEEPRFLLSRAIATDQRWATDIRREVLDESGTPSPEHVDAVRRQYAAAIAQPETAAEAHIRLAWFLHRIGEHDEARIHLNDAERTPLTEPSLRYLRHLFLGHVFGALERQDDAIATYRKALVLVPSAQSSRVALMNALLTRGDRAEAEAMAERVQAETDSTIDPWWMYWQGQYRFHPQAMARIREMRR